MYTFIAGKKNDPNLMPFKFALKAFIEDERLKIPVLPDVIGKVITLINHPKADANTLARLIHKDQALAGYVLRVSNSPIFAGTHEISTLRQAIARIGARTLGKIALSITMQGKIFKVDGYQEDIKDIWRKTLTAGAFAQDIGHLIGETSESLYLCGLLHTVGKPVILQALQDLKGELKMELSHAGGMELMESFHQQVGHKVAEQWKLPDAVKESCIHYLNPESADRNLKEVRITYLAHKFSHFIDEDPDEETLEILVEHPSVVALGIRKIHLELLVTRLEKVRLQLEIMALA